MKDRYKVILSNKNLYKEIELTSDMEEIRAGTGSQCACRLRRDLFFDDIELIFTRAQAGWSLTCSDGIYITSGDVKKNMRVDLAHGQNFEIRYHDSGNFIFFVEFLIDFDDGNNRYERTIDVSNQSCVLIGSEPSYNIVLRSPYAQNDLIELQRNDSGLVLNIRRTSFGVYINGKKAKSGDTLSNMDFLSVSDYFFYLKNNRLRTQIRSDMVINSLPFEDLVEPYPYPRFDTNTRIRIVPGSDEIEVLDPPSIPQKPKNSLITRLLPAASMFVMAGAMASMGSSMIIMSVISGFMCIITAVVGMTEGKKEYKIKTTERLEKYNAYIAKKDAQITEARANELSELEQIYVSGDVLRQRLATFSSDLFDRTKDDEDFLCIRLGTGNVPALRKIRYKKQERLEIEDNLQLMPEHLCEKYENIEGAPVVCGLKVINALGITGPQNARFEFLKNIVLDIAARHFYTDVELFFVAEEKNKDAVKWLRFLPNAFNDVIGTRNIVCNDESKNLIFEYLYKELTFREMNKKYDKNMVVFFYDEYGFRNHPVSKFIENAAELGATFIFFGDKSSAIPSGCDDIICIDNETHARIIDTKDRSNTTGFVYQPVPTSFAENVVRLLAPVYTEEISLEGSLTKNITLFELLKIFSAADLDLERRWNSSQVFKSMAVPVGVSKTGVTYLDLHDKAHGPHGLVAGTTGSGKSELLQTYVLSVATYFHPYEVAFVIIDFKGGGMANQFRDLPHLSGAITNIDGKAIDRSLKSIKAELKKRQRYFAQVKVNHIDAYIKKYKSGQVKEPLPHLIIIVDEFAELKASQPEFMKELISAARIGRSLGVHLILATQKPAGQVDEQIWSNSRFKLCLKVQSTSDSNEVIKSPLAAEIKEAGRAYMQVGNNEIFELFQSAYSGAPERIDDMDLKEFTIYSYTDSGKKIPVYARKKKNNHAGKNQLEAIVDYVADYCTSKKIAKLPDICLPALPEVIDHVSSKGKRPSSSMYEVDLGIYDDPDNQYQGSFKIDLAADNLMIIGSAQTGKTNMLQNIIRSLAESFTPQEAVIYIMDFASMILKNFESLAHVGGVVCASEDEKLKNLFKLLHTQIEERKERLIGVGVSSFAAYKEAGFKDLPLIVVLIDNLTALRELYLLDNDDLLDICRDGLAVGISIVIANSQTSGMGYKYLSNFAGRIALYCNDSGEYTTLFDHCREKPDNTAGRCLVEIDKQHYECQSYLAFRGEKEIERVDEIRKFIEEINRKNTGLAAGRIPVIPEFLTKELVMSQLGGFMGSRFDIVMGLDYSDVTPYIMNLAQTGVLAVSGREGAGRHNWFRYCVNMLETVYPSQSDVYIVDSIGKKLKSLKDMDNVAGYSMFANDAGAFIKEIEEKLAKRYEALSAGNEEVLSDSKLLILAIDNPDAIANISSEKELLASYKNITGRYKYLNVCVVLFMENANISYSSPEVLKELRDKRNFMFFEDMANMKIFDVPLSFTRKFKKAIVPGDGYYIKENECIKLKTPFYR